MNIKREIKIKIIKEIKVLMYGAKEEKEIMIFIMLKIEKQDNSRVSILTKVYFS